MGELFFLGRFAQEKAVQALARDVPAGSVVIVAYALRECREDVYSNGTVVSDDSVYCVPLNDMMTQNVRVLDAQPFFTANASRYLRAGSPVFAAPMDSPARAMPQHVDRELASDPDAIPASHRVRVDFA